MMKHCPALSRLVFRGYDQRRVSRRLHLLLLCVVANDVAFMSDRGGGSVFVECGWGLSEIKNSCLQEERRERVFQTKKKRGGGGLSTTSCEPNAKGDPQSENHMIRP
jgi:hypothetical protein